MAITGPLYRFYRDLHARGVLPQGGSILEIGEANWYGDISPEVLRPESELGTNQFSDQILDLRIGWNADDRMFGIAKVMYKRLFAPKDITSIDLGGTDKAIPTDLNYKINPLVHGKYNVVINNGTAEHIFNIGQVFESMHDLCAVSGLMIHDAPFTGWIDHGFYCLQPTLFWDIAAANDYEIVAAAIGHIGRQSLLYITSREQIHELAKLGGLPENTELLIAFKKGLDDPFRFPMQGCYNGSLTKEAARNWHALR